ncbi:hypothetical protein [Ponticaulis sp.]|uniref:DUF883 family protein n=1 Tax=Ponticaulis sp. TaxID=2020902 RepID=UPI000B702227|nr:hypothetical protein [Ponticaulis sp.]MAI88982.1 hypothetical protein [Ponticaulis sp.]OUY01667.1 MAG: hypothetical protein CBB65_00685 [Hyphomonadaceae bacterium TMED5]|tara:strand:+ start:98680 stop:98991 length:312 start_codon:yes stop_codon:yes gene_type:complete
MTLHNITDTATEPKQEIDQDVSNLRQDFESLKDNVGSLFAHVTKLAGERAEKGADQTKEFAGDAVEKAKDAQGYVETRIREKPLAAVGIAAGVGALAAILMRK